MALCNNLKLLFFFSSIIISLHFAKPQLSPSASPLSSPHQETGGSASSASPSSSTNSPSNSGPVSSPSSSSAYSPSSYGSVSSSSAEAPLNYGPVSSPSAEAPSNYAPSYAPSITEPPSSTVSPDAESPSESDDIFDIPLTLPPSFKVDSQVKNICDSTDYPDLCVASVAPFLKGKTDVQAVIATSINVGERLSGSALAQTQKLAATKEASPEHISILKDCEDSYDTALYNFQKANSAFPEGGIGTMNSMLSVVITDLADCDDAFAGLGSKSPLSGIAEKMANLTSNCIAVISLLD